jgi:hypothetical protein
MIALLATTDFDEGKTEKGGEIIVPTCAVQSP